MISICIISTIVAVIVAVINVYCCIVIIHSKKLKSVSHMTVFSLLLGHALQGIFVIPLYAKKHSRVTTGAFMCDLFRFTYLFTNYACALSVLVITAARFIGVRYPLRYKVWVSSHRMSRGLLIVWAYVLVLCLVPFASTGKKKKCTYNPQRWWVMMMLLGNTLLPFVIIFIFYITILKAVKNVLIRRQSNSVRHVHRDKTTIKTNNDVTNNSNRVQMKKTKMTYLIVGAYVICWGPSLFYNLLRHICPKQCFPESYEDSQTEMIISFVTKLLTFIDGIISPTIYCWINDSFKTMRQGLMMKFKKKNTTVLLSRKKAVRRPSTSFEMKETKKVSMRVRDENGNEEENTTRLLENEETTPS